MPKRLCTHTLQAKRLPQHPLAPPLRLTSVLVAILLLLASPLQAEAQDRGLRIWRDATGNFSVKAKLLVQDRFVVMLRTDDGRDISVPVSKLSQRDRAYLRDSETGTKKKVTPAATRQAIEKVLTGRPQPAGEVKVVDLAKRLQIPVFVDRRALEEVGLTVDIPVQLKDGHGSFQEQLDDALEPNDLASCATQTVLVITTTEGIHEYASAKFYRIPTPRMVLNGRPLFDTNSVLEKIQQVEPGSWEVMGGPGTVTPFGTAYVVRQTPVVHRKLSKALGRQPAAHQYGHRFDQQSVAVTANNHTLEDVIKSIASQLGVAVEFSPSLADIGVTPSGGRGLYLDFQNVSTKDALDLILSQFDCTWAEENDKLIVQSEDFAEENLSTQRITVNLGPMMNNNRFMQAIQFAVAPDTWEVLGGEGQISAMRPGLFIVRQGQPAMREVEQFMRDLKALR